MLLFLINLDMIKNVILLFKDDFLKGSEYLISCLSGDIYEQSFFYFFDVVMTTPAFGPLFDLFIGTNHD